MCRFFARITAVAVLIWGIIALALFRFTRFFGLGTSSASQLTLNVWDLREERIRCTASQEGRFDSMLSFLCEPDVTQGELTLAVQLVSDLIAEVEERGPYPSAVLRTTRMQIYHDLGEWPLKDDVLYVWQAIQQPSFSPRVRYKIAMILEAMGVPFERTTN